MATWKLTSNENQCVTLQDEIQSLTKQTEALFFEHGRLCLRETIMQWYCSLRLNLWYLVDRSNHWSACISRGKQGHIIRQKGNKYLKQIKAKEELAVAMNSHTHTFEHI